MLNKLLNPILRTACRISVFNKPANFCISRIHISNRFKDTIFPISRNFSLLPDNSLKQSDELTDNSIDPEINQRKLDVLKLEASVLQQEGRKVPDPEKLKPDNWKQLLNLPTKTSRIKYYAYLWKLEKMRENRQVRFLLLALKNDFQFCFGKKSYLRKFFNIEHIEGCRCKLLQSNAY